MTLEERIRNRLSKGQIIKNYKELCSILELPLLGGNAKKKQMKEIEIFCHLIKDKHSILVDEIIDHPSVIENKRSLYTKHITEIILGTYESTFENKNISTTSLWKNLGLINDLYGVDALVMHLLKSVDETIEPWQLEKFYNICSSKFNSILYDSLHYLSQRDIIQVERPLEGCYEEEGYKIYKEINSSYEINLINSIEAEELKNMNVCDKRQLFLYGADAIKEYNALVQAHVSDALGYNFYYHAYRITKKEINLSKYDLSDINYSKKLLNLEARTAISKLLESDYRKHHLKIGKIPGCPVYTENYCKQGNIIMDRLMSIDSAA